MHGVFFILLFQPSCVFICKVHLLIVYFWLFSKSFLDMSCLFRVSSPLYLIWLLVFLLYLLYFVVFLWLFSEFSFHLVFKNLTMKCPGVVFFLIYTTCGFLSLLDIVLDVFHQFWKALSHYVLSFLPYSSFLLELQLHVW